jgi:hypothetical protein
LISASESDVLLSTKRAKRGWRIALELTTVSQLEFPFVALKVVLVISTQFLLAARRQSKAKNFGKPFASLHCRTK